MNWVAFFHRWMGVILAPFFVMWFLSGIVMIYVPFPSVTNLERLTYMSKIELDRIAIEPTAALETCRSKEVFNLRIITFNSRPAYVCHAADQELKVIYADDAIKSPRLTKDEVRKLLERERELPILRMEELDYDQWTVHQRFDQYRPFYRVALADSSETNLYIAPTTGELLQKTTNSQRFWNYIGSIPHWIYPTLLRKNWVLWDAFVWWLSLIGVFCAVTGVYLGAYHWVKIRNQFSKALSPFRGWMRWHHIVGLFAGLILVSWISSGWLSMDHGRLFSTQSPTAQQASAVRGGTLGEISSKVNLADLRRHTDALELSFHAFGGVPVIIGKNLKGILETGNLEPSHVASVIDNSFPEVAVTKWSVVSKGDLYTDLREGSLPPNTIRVELSDTHQSWVHIDGRSGEILSVMDRSRRSYRWLYNGLHSLDIPGLVNKRPLWDLVMITLLLGGLAASITAMAISVKRILKKT